MSTDPSKKVSVSLGAAKGKPIGVSLGRALVPQRPSVPLNIQVEEEKKHIITINESSSTTLEDLKRLQEEADGTVKKALVIPVAPDRVIVPTAPSQATQTPDTAISTEGTTGNTSSDQMTDEERSALAAARAALGEPAEPVDTVVVPDIMALDEDIMGNEPDAEDYEEVPIEAFGAAMLRGMGWAPGAGVGRTNKKVVDEVDLSAGHNGRLGLGADASTLALKKALAKQAEGGKKGAVDIAAQLAVGAQAGKAAKDALWQERKARAAAEMASRVIKVRALTVQVGGLVAVKVGEHEGMYGRIIKVDQRDDNSSRRDASDAEWSSVDVRLNVGGAVLRGLRREDVDLVDEAALPSDHPALLDYDYRSAAGGVLRGAKGVKAEEALGAEQASAGDLRGGHREGDGGRGARDMSSRDKSGAGRRSRDNGRDRERGREKGGEGAAQREWEPASAHGQERERRSAWTWVRPNIVVKITDPAHEYYRHKGVVQRISEHSGRCYLLVESARDRGKNKARDEVVSVSRQRDIETVVPERDGAVVVVRGRHSGCKGWVNRRDGERQEVEVEVEVEKGRFERINVSFDDVCMWKRAQ